MKGINKKRLLEWWYRVLRYCGLVTMSYHQKRIALPPFTVIEFDGCRTLISIKAFLTIIYKSKNDDCRTCFEHVDRILRSVYERGEKNIKFVSALSYPFLLEDEPIAPSITMSYIRFSIMEVRCNAYPRDGWKWKDTYPRQVLTVNDEGFQGSPHQLLHVITEKQIKKYLGSTL